ncbi:MAG: hypothetical protein II984_03745, partial [Clostridia bacterium]|nr:hypothetical protein [Clostridia bacterium]
WNYSENIVVHFANIEDNYAVVVKGSLTIDHLNCDFDDTDFGIGVQPQASLTINGGTFTNSHIYLIGSWGTTVITSGKFYAQYCTVNAFDGKLTIMDGTFSVTDDDATDEYPPSCVFGNGEVNILGGHFNTDVSDYMTPGYVQEKDGLVHICIHTWTATGTACENGCGVTRAAYIGNVNYATFDAAYKAANVGDTIVLVAPITITSDTTIDKNGITIESAGDVFVVTSGTLTIDGNITVKAGTANAGSWCALWANGGNVIINNGTYSVGIDTSTTDTTHQNDLIYTKNGGTVVINGGTFDGRNGIWALNRHDSTGGAITVKGGTFLGFNPQNNVSEGNNTNFVASGYVSVADENGAYNVIKCNHETTVIVDYIYANGFDKDGVEVSKCTVCNSEFEKTASKLFTFLGYSVPEDGRGEIVFGYDVNHDAIASYESVTNKTLTYGVFAALDTIGTKDIFAENSGAITNEVAKTSIAFEFKMTGLDTEEYKALKMALGAYVIVDGNVSYMQGGEPAEGDKYEFVSYNLVLNNTK